MNIASRFLVAGSALALAGCESTGEDSSPRSPSDNLNPVSLSDIAEGIQSLTGTPVQYFQRGDDECAEGQWGFYFEDDKGNIYSTCSETGKNEHVDVRRLVPDASSYLQEQAPLNGLPKGTKNICNKLISGAQWHMTFNAKANLAYCFISDPSGGDSHLVQEVKFERAGVLGAGSPTP